VGFFFRLFRTIVNRRVAKIRYVSLKKDYSISFEGTKLDWFIGGMFWLMLWREKGGEQHIEASYFTDPDNEAYCGTIFTVSSGGMIDELHKTFSKNLDLLGVSNQVKLDEYEQKHRSKIIDFIRETNKDASWKCNEKLTKRLKKSFFAFQVVGEMTLPSENPCYSYDFFVPVGGEVVKINAIIKHNEYWKEVLSDLEMIANSFDMSGFLKRWEKDILGK